MVNRSRIEGYLNVENKKRNSDLILIKRRVKILVWVKVVKAPTDHNLCQMTIKIRSIITP